jgi:NAD(P)H-hydrate epimerase
LLPRRTFNSHKGDYGRIGIVAGAPGMLGAAVLCATAASRAGAGLVTLYATPDTVERLSVIAPPEVMVYPVASFAEVAQRRHDVFALGPGLGPHRHPEILPLIEHVRQPMVVDADGLNALAQHPAILDKFAGERVLTPHPGEMERLDPTAAKRSRREVVKSFVQSHPRCTLLLKGARTLVGKSGEPLSYNSTGTPGMATGGMGDILTGVIAALIGQRVRPFDAARLGAWLCGCAGELAILQGAETEETLTPSRLLDFLAPALRALRRRCY